MHIEIKADLPTAEGFVALRCETDWERVSLQQAQASLKASLCGICLYDKRTIPPTLIAMARVVGDGVLNLFIQDVIIAKNHRGQYPETCTIGLMAAKNQAPFYKHFGFLSRPTSTVDAGMYARLSDLQLH